MSHLNWKMRLARRIFPILYKRGAGEGRGLGVGVDLGGGGTVVVGVGVGVGVVVGVGVGVALDCAQYLPPVFQRLISSVPPQTIISLPVHTAVWLDRPAGALVVPVGVQVSSVQPPNGLAIKGSV